MNPNISVHIRSFENGKGLKGFADVTFRTEAGELTICGFCIRQRDGEAPWVGFPASSYLKDGKQVNKPILEVGRLLRKTVEDAILDAYKLLKGTT